MEPLLISVPNPAQFIARDVGNTEVYELWNFINAGIFPTMLIYMNAAYHIHLMKMAAVVGQAYLQKY